MRQIKLQSVHCTVSLSLLTRYEFSSDVLLVERYCDRSAAARLLFHLDIAPDVHRLATLKNHVVPIHVSKTKLICSHCACACMCE